eukprot:PhM_4_TR6183/c0_g1_i1/m.100225
MCMRVFFFSKRWLVFYLISIFFSVVFSMFLCCVFKKWNKNGMNNKKIIILFFYIYSCHYGCFHFREKHCHGMEHFRALPRLAFDRNKVLHITVLVDTIITVLLLLLLLL